MLRENSFVLFFETCECVCKSMDSDVSRMSLRCTMFLQCSLYSHLQYVYGIF